MQRKKWQDTHYQHDDDGTKEESIQSTGDLRTVLEEGPYANASSCEVLILINRMIDNLFAFIAAQMLQKMSPDVDPCDDFYQYACGGYIGTQEAHPDYPHRSLVFEMEENLAVLLKRK